MTVYLVGAGPGDPGLLTRRGAELLGSAEVVVYDRLVDRSVLELAGPGAELIDAGRFRFDAASGSERQELLNALLVDWGRRAHTVVRLKGGDPFLFGRGGEEMEALRAAGIPCEVVPGVSSAFSVPALAGVPVTHRGLSASVTVVTGQVGDPSAPGGIDWQALGSAGGTVVVLMGVATRAEIVRRLMDAGRPPDTPVLAVERGTTPAERVVRSTLAELAAADVANPAVLVVGAVAALDLRPADDTSTRTGGAPGSGPESLAGRIVVLTRQPERELPLHRALVSAGARVVEVPATTTSGPAEPESLRAAALAVADYDWLLFTSATAVDRFLAQVPDLRPLASVRIGAVGAATADALAAYRLVADLVPGRSTADGLLDALGEISAPPASTACWRALFPRARDARRTLPDGLGAKGWHVDEVEAYATLSCPTPPAPALRAVGEADAVVFAAPSALAAWTGWLDGAGRPVPVPPVVVCAGATTADAVRRAGLVVAEVATTPTPEEILRALARALGSVPGHTGHSGGPRPPRVPGP